MAVNAREMMLIIRAQNQASGALRRVGKDLQSLGKRGDIARAQQQLAIREQSLLRQRQRALNEIEDLTSGSRFQNLQNRAMQIEGQRNALASKRAQIERDRVKLENAGIAAKDAGSRIANDLFATETARLAKTKQIEAAERAVTRAKKEQASLFSRSGRALPGMRASGAIDAATLGVSNAERDLQIRQRQLQTLIARTDELTVSQGRNVARQTELSGESSKLAAATDAVARAETRLDAVTIKLSADQAKAAARLNILQSELTENNARLNVLRGDMARLDEQANAMRWEGLLRGGSIMQHLARTFQMAGLVIGGTMVYAASAAAKFQTQATLAATQVSKTFHGGPNSNIAASAGIQRGILDILKSRKSAGSPADQNTAAYDIFSSMTLKGSQASQIKQGIGLLRQFNRAAIAGQTDLKSVTEAGITILNDFAQNGKQVQQMPSLMNRMFAAVRFGRMTFGEFVSSLNQVAPAFSAAFGRNPQSFNQMAEAMAGLTRHIPSVRMAGTALARLSEMLGRPDFIKGLQMMHIPITTGVGNKEHLKPLMTIIDLINKHIPSLKNGGLQLQNFYKTVTALGSGKAGTAGTIQGRRAFQFLIQNGKSYHDIAQQVLHDNNEFQKSFEAMQNTPQVQWKEFLNVLKALSIEIGTNVIPVLVQLSQPLVQASKWFNGLDDSTKRTIARWATFGSAGLILGSMLLFLVGTTIKWISVMGKMGVITRGPLSTFLLLATAVVVLTHNFYNLGQIVDDVLHGFTDHGVAGWAAMLGLAAVAAYKLASALRAVATAQAVGGAASSAGGILGLLGGGRRIAGDMRAAGQLGREAGGIKGILSGAALAAAAIPGPLWVAGAAIGLAAGGALLWEHHMKGVRERAAEVAEQLKHIKTIAAAPTIPAKQLAGLGNDVRSVSQARAAVDEINKQIAAAKKAHESQSQLQQLYIQRANALDVVDAANTRANRSFNAMTSSIGKQGRLLREVTNQHKTLNQLLEERNQRTNVPYTRGMPLVRPDAMPITNKELDARIARAQDAIRTLRAGAISGANALAASFARTVQSLSRAKFIPKVDPAAMRDMFSLALKKGRMLTIPEMKAVIRAEVNAASLRKASADIRKVITGNRKAIRITAQLKYDHSQGANEKALERGIKVATTVTPPKNTHSVQNGIAKVFRKTIIQRIVINPNAGAAFAKATAIGANIALGAASGVKSQAQAVADAAVAMVDNALNAARARGRIKSPSGLFRDKVGIPIVEGIIAGIISKQNVLATTAALTMTTLAGAFIQKRQSAIDAWDPATAKEKLAQAKKDQAQLEKWQTKLGTSGLRVARIENTIANIRGKKNTNNADMRHIALLKAEETQLTASAKAGDKYNQARIKQLQLKIKTERAEAVKPRAINVGDLIRDTVQQANQLEKFNRSFGKLSANKRIPRAMLDELAALGADGTKYITLLANATPRQLSKFVAAWKRGEAAVKKSTRATVQDVTDLKNATKQQLDDLTTTATQKLLDTWNSFNETAKSQFGDLFGGSSNLSDKIGDAFKTATDDYTSKVTDFQKQILDDNNQIADLTQQATDRLTQAIADRVSELQTAFGQLFSGDWMTGSDVSTRAQWGINATFDDLFKDLQAQTDKFDHWRKDLADLAAKVPPDLAKQLEALGPDAVGSLDALNGATQDQLAKYVDLWRRGQTNIAGIAQSTTVDTSDITSQMKTVLDDIDAVTKQLADLAKPQSLTGSDVIGDLQGQVDAFGQYQDVLAALAGKDLPKELIQQLQGMGTQALPYLQALNNMSADQLGKFVGLWQTAQGQIFSATNSMMQTQVQLWTQHGADIASALIAGVQSEQPQLEAYFKNLFQGLLTGKIPDTIAPSANNIAELEFGGTAQYDKSGLPPSIPGASYSNESSITFNQTVNAHASQSLDSTLHTAKFRLLTQLGL